MALMSDQWIEKQVQENNIISPFEKTQIREGKYHMVYQVMDMMQGSLMNLRFLQM